MLNMRVRGENEQEMAEKREDGPAAAREQGNHAENKDIPLLYLNMLRKEEICCRDSGNECLCRLSVFKSGKSQS